MKLIFTIKTLIIAIWDFVSRFSPEHEIFIAKRKTEETAKSKGGAK